MMQRILGAGMVLLVAGLAFSQSTTPGLTFEVASIKPSSGDEHRIGIMVQPGGGLRTAGTSLKMLLTFAYDVRDFQISGGPGWINSDRYDILAKPDRGSSDSPPSDPGKMTEEQAKTEREKMQQRLQGLLKERFQLAIHRETKEQSVYALVVGKSGSKLKESQAKSGDGRRRMMSMGRGQISAEGVPLEMLTNVLSNQLGRPVIDRTGLKGPFDIKLEWTPDPGQAGPFGGQPPPGVDAPPPPDPNGPSIFTALQDQLGLRLESQKGPVELIVIDKIEKPSEN